MSKTTAQEQHIRELSLECASRVGKSEKGDVRIVLKNAALFEAWLTGDETEVVVLLKDRFG